MNHYHDHERQTRRVGAERPKMPWQILADLHRCVKKQASLLFQIYCHQNLGERSAATHLLKTLTPNKAAENWEDLRNKLWVVGVHIHPYHLLPEKESPIESFSGGMDATRWRSLTPEGLQRLAQRNRTKQDNAKSEIREEGPQA